MYTGAVFCYFIMFNATVLCTQKRIFPCELLICNLDQNQNKQQKRVHTELKDYQIFFEVVSHLVPEQKLMAKKSLHISCIICIE